MSELSAFPITARWPAQHPDRLQLYSLPTPNGVKVSIMLEEIGLPYEPHTINIGKNETFTPEYLSLNPNGKIPAIIDPDGPDGAPLAATCESGAILQPPRREKPEIAPGRSGAAALPDHPVGVLPDVVSIGPMFGQIEFLAIPARRGRRQASARTLRC